MLTMEHRSAVYHAGNWSCTTNSCMSSLLHLLCSFCLHSLCLKNGFTIFSLFDGYLWTAQVQTRYAWARCHTHFIHNGFPWFLLRTHVLEGFKVQISVLLQGHGQSYAMASSANCNNPVSSVTVQYGATLKGKKSWFKIDSFPPPSKKEIFLHTEKVPKKPQTETNKLFKGLQNRWDGMIYYCWMLDEKLVLHCMYQITWNGY